MSLSHPSLPSLCPEQAELMSASCSSEFIPVQVSPGRCFHHRNVSLALGSVFCVYSSCHGESFSLPHSCSSDAVTGLNRI